MPSGGEERAALLGAGAIFAPRRGSGSCLRTAAAAAFVLLVVAVTVLAWVGSRRGSDGGGSGGGGLKLGENWDVHRWQTGDWWRPGDRSSAAHEQTTQQGGEEEGVAPLSPSHRDIEGNGNAHAAAGSTVAAVGQPREGQSSSPVEKWKIVSFSSDNYLDITKLWYNRLSELGYTEHVVGALDGVTFDALTQAGFRVEDHVVSPSEVREPGEPVPGWGRHLWKLWRYRLSYALRQTQMGVNVFLVDVDSMWSRYVPLAQLFGGDTRDRAVDMFIGQGSVYPQDVFDKWGFVGCMGSVGFRATKNTAALLRLAVKECDEGSCDDQVSINHALMNIYKVVWDHDTGIGVGHRGVVSGDRIDASGDQLEASGDRIELSSDADVRDLGQVTVRMWPKPFVFRSFMQDVKKVGELGATSATVGLGEGAAGTCLGQKNLHDVGANLEKEGSVDVTGLEHVGSAVDFTTPFIASPISPKDGATKVDIWNKFQRGCFVISTPSFQINTLPSASPSAYAALGAGAGDAR